MFDLCQGIASCITLTQVDLRAVGVCHQDTDALRTFANVMSCHPALQDINLDGNLVGEFARQLMRCIPLQCEVISVSVAQLVACFAVMHYAGRCDSALVAQ